MPHTVFTKGILNQEKPSQFKILLRLFANIVFENPKIFLFSSFLAFITSIINFNIAMNMKRAFVFTISGEKHIKDIIYNFELNWGLGKMIQRVDLISFLFYTFFLMVVGKAIFSLFHYFYLNYAFEKIEKDLKISLFRHFIRADYTNSTEISRNLINQFAGDLESISRNVWFIPNRLIYVFTSIFFTIAFAFKFGGEDINWKFILIVIFLFASLFFIVFILSRKAIILNVKARKRRQKDNQHIYERINNLEYIKSVSGENIEEEKLEKQLSDTFRKNRKSLVWSVLFKAAPSYVLIPNIPNLFIIVSVFTFANFIPGQSGWESKIFWAVNFGLYYSSVQTLRDEVDKIISCLLNLEELISDTNLVMENIQKLEKNRKIKMNLPFTNNDIVYEKVQFSYPTRPNIILDNFSFTFRKGMRYGIIGENGKGKSTITKTLLKLYKLRKGQISINGKNIQDIDTQSLHRKILHLTNRPGFFRMSIAENIIYPEKLKEGDLARIEKYLWTVGVDKFISSLPKGLNTELKENGSDLSEGQKQQIAMIRLFIRNPDIIIFDEILANVAPEIKEKILIRIFQTLKDKTILIIDHHYSIFRHVEEVYNFTGKELVKIEKEELNYILDSQKRLS